MQLTKRLQAIADRVPKDTCVVDVGTDHGYIPIYLTRHGLCKKCIASDINQGPLDSAKKHSLKYQMNDLDLRKGSGLQTVSPKDAVEVIIIAGMGGTLVIDILKKDCEIVKGAKKLILQPQTNVMDVRKFLHEINFKISEETFLEEDGKYYTIISAEPGEESYPYVWQYVYGDYLLRHPNNTFSAWMTQKAQIFDKIKKQLESADENQRQVRVRQLDEEYAQYKEAMQCLLQCNK